MQQPHRLLQRQLKRHFGDPAALPPEWQDFLAAVNDAYWQADDDRTRLERTLELSSQELLQANAKTQILLQTVETQVAERTAELMQTNADLQTALKELKHTQAQLVQTEKMSSLGQLVAGVAHEINNPVNFIHGNLPYASQYVRSLLKLVQCYQQQYPQPTPDLQAEIELIDLDFLVNDLPNLLVSMQVGVDRIKQIVLSLRQFSRLDEAAMKSVDLHTGIDSTLMILQHRLRAQPNRAAIQVVRQFTALPKVECYVGQLNQVFMNILANAIDALEESIQKHAAAHPTITIRTETVGSDYVLIRIADNGIGMSDQVRRSLFDPFFTTKPVGKGTGLGMSISYQIVTARHNGKIKCKSTLGQGTEFLITIPVRQCALKAG